MSEKVLALYDFASKQAYIYRTSKIKEISGASLLLSGMYKRFPGILEHPERLEQREPMRAIKLRYDLGSPFSMEAFENGSCDGEALYEGGGNLMVLWRSFGAYRDANRILSVYLLKHAPGLTLIASAVPCGEAGLFDDGIGADGKAEKGDRTRLYEENARKKRFSPAFDLPAVMPFTQIDPATFLPVRYKRNRNEQGSVYPAAACSLSADRYAKAAAYERAAEKTDVFDAVGEGMAAVIYIDGNSMGNKLIACRRQRYDDGVARLREFSARVNGIFVERPLACIKRSFPVRTVIGGGDEITLICRAKDAFRIMTLYFETLQNERLCISGVESRCTASAGIAVFHAKSPFSVAYEIAEAACEAAKKKAHETDGYYFCFYYCHANVSNTFDVLHAAEQKHASGKPYETGDMDRIERCAAMLRAAGRANVKALGNAAQVSVPRYLREVKRVNAYLGKNAQRFEGTEEEMRMVYDLSEFYDLWFAKEVVPDEEDAGN